MKSRIGGRCTVTTAAAVTHSSA